MSRDNTNFPAPRSQVWLAPTRQKTTPSGDTINVLLISGNCSKLSCWPKKNPGKGCSAVIISLLEGHFSWSRV